MSDALSELLDHLEVLLDGIDALHRLALRRLADGLGSEQIAALRDDAAVAWLFDAYAIGVDEWAVAEAALAEVRPYLASHGGSVEVLGAQAGTVRLRLAGACSGCTASAETLRNEIERSLRDNFPGFDHLEVEPDDADAHPPPVSTPIQLSPRPIGGRS